MPRPRQWTSRNQTACDLIAQAKKSLSLAPKLIAITWIANVLSAAMQIPTHSRFRDLTGKVFGRLTVVSYEGPYHKQHRWACRCSCGNSCLRAGGELEKWKVPSCGCHLVRDVKHGRYYTATYTNWRAMVNRCTTNPNYRYYKHYAGRGITICERWKSFENFLADMGERPAGLSLERIDNDRGYEPGNCKWASRQEQSRNQTRNLIVSAFGESHPLAVWAERFGIEYYGLWRDVRRRGMTLEQSLAKRRIA